jgi:hypothetical protein
MRWTLAVLAALVVVALGAWKGDALVDKLLDLRFGGYLPNATYPPPALARRSSAGRRATGSRSGRKATRSSFRTRRSA